MLTDVRHNAIKHSVHEDAINADFIQVNVSRMMKFKFYN